MMRKTSALPSAAGALLAVLGDPPATLGRAIRRTVQGLCWAGVLISLTGEAQAAPAPPPGRSVRKPVRRLPLAVRRPAKGTRPVPIHPVKPPSTAPIPDVEPPPAGEIAVQWARPLQPHAGAKVRAYPTHGAPALGDMRGDTAIALKLDPPKRGGAGCRGWFAVLPDGFVCQDQVRVQPGYLSSPPAQARAKGWQRMRYGVVRAETAVLESSPGGTATRPVAEAGYLRGTLRRGDGVTVVREREDRVQIFSRHWLRRGDVTLASPSPMAPINLQALPVGQRLMVAWVVPPQGETQTRLALPGMSGPGVMLPRYTPLYWSDVRPSQGRTVVHLTDEARAILAGKPEAQAAAFEIDSTQLRRITPAQPPSGLHPDERWIDISVSEQVAVAYQGDAPLFAALVSTGAHGATPPGTFWVYRKYLSQTMANMRGAASQYDFREVPHAQFFNGRIGLHAVLWHDLLGHPVSHGCVNMSPATAEQFFSFTKPDLPAGWHTVNGDPPHRGAPWLRGTRIVVRK